MDKRNEEKEVRIYDVKFWLFLILTVGLFTFVCFLPYLLTKSGKVDFIQTGQIGDTIGGIMSPFVAIIVGILTFLAFWVQYKANIIQQREIAIDRFETKLFNMIALHEELTSKIKFINEDVKSSSVNYPEGRAIFEFIYNKRNMGWHKGLRHSIVENGYEVIKNDKSLWCLDHYFRHLYALLKYIDTARVLNGNINQKYEYISIINAMMSEYELIILFYYILGTNDIAPDFKSIAERYGFFQSLRIEDLALSKEQKYYKELIDSEKQNENQGLDQSYGRGAFIFKLQ